MRFIFFDAPSTSRTLLSQTPREDSTARLRSTTAVSTRYVERMISRAVRGLNESLQARYPIGYSSLCEKNCATSKKPISCRSPPPVSELQRSVAGSDFGS